MRKKVFIILSLLFLFGLKAQERNDICLDYNPVLNKAESNYLNKFIGQNVDNFDFTNKKIGFAIDDGEILNKKTFFQQIENVEKKEIGLIHLDSTEKTNSGNYDAFVLIKKENRNLNENTKKVFIHLFSEREINVPANLYQMGVEDKSILNQYEVEYFNKIFIDSEFDFNGRRIGFIVGGNIIQTKMYYFDDIKERLSNNTIASHSKGYLIILTDEQKIKSGGYDAIIFTWCKIIPKINKKMLKRLKENGARPALCLLLIEINNCC